MPTYEKERTLYISDLDGTLLGPGATLSDYATDVINRLTEEGCYFTVATARTAASSEIILARLKPSLPIVLMNGAMIYDRANKTCVLAHYIHAAAAAAIITALASIDAKAFLYTWENESLSTWHEPLTTEPMRAFVAERMQKYYKTFHQVARLSEVPTVNILYFTLLDTKERIERAREVLSPIPGLGLVAYLDVYGDQWFLEVFSEDASKQNAALFLKQRDGFQRLVGFGDNINDLPLFAACDYTLAVENARAEVKAAAHEVIGPNTEDGVARWLAAFIEEVK